MDLRHWGAVKETKRATTGNSNHIQTEKQLCQKKKKKKKKRERERGKKRSHGSTKLHRKINQVKPHNNTSHRSAHVKHIIMSKEKRNSKATLINFVYSMFLNENRRGRQTGSENINTQTMKLTHACPGSTSSKTKIGEGWVTDAQT